MAWEPVSPAKPASVPDSACNPLYSSALLAQGFAALAAADINVQMISQGASKVNISMVCDDGEAARVVRVLHAAFFDE